jgi:hypothetical protein
MSVSVRHAAVALLLSFTCGPVSPVYAEVRRCQTPDGRTVYTDRACQDLGAVERLQGLASDAPPVHRLQCSRTVQDLALEVGMAIERRDANALAGLYHWPGTATRDGYAIMERLDAIASRPLVDIRALFPDEPAMHDSEAPVAAAPDPSATPATATSPPSSAELLRNRAPWQPPAVAAAASVTPELPTPAAKPTPSRTRVPHALQLDQTLANGSTPSRTVFGLRRHLGCWWISL